MKAADAGTIDRVREAEGSDSKIKITTDDANRWLKIDAEEVLHKIHELERVLNEHKKHTTIPAWAKTLNPRLEGLDAKIAKLPSKPREKSSQESVTHHLTDEQYKAISGDFHQKNEEMKSVFDTQTIDLEANVERLKDQLNIRPTSTELSKVNLLLSDVKNQIRANLTSVQMGSFQMIEDKVASEVENLSKKMHISENNREKGIESTMKKTERFHQLISTVKEEISDKISSTQGEHEEIVRKYNTYTPRYGKVEKRLNDNVIECKKKFEEAKNAQAIALQSFTEFKGYTNTEQDKLNKATEQIGLKLKNVDNKMLEKDTAQTERFNAIDEKVQDFLRLYEFDFTKVKEDVNNLKITALERQHSTLTEQNDFLALLKHRDIMNVVTTQEENIAKIFESIKDFEARLATQNDIIKTVEGMIAIVSDEMENFPDMVTQQTLRLIKLHQLLDNSTNAMAEMKSSFETVTSNVSELYAMSADVAEIKDAGARSNDKVDEVQAKLSTIKEKADAHDKIILEIREMLGEVESNFDGALLEAKDDVKNEVVENCGSFSENTDKVLLDVELQHAKLADHHFDNMSGSKSQSLDPNSILDGGDSEIVVRPSPVTMHEAEMVARMCLSYEGLGARTNTVPNIPDAICEQLLHIAQQLTNHTASSTDLEAVEALISETNLKVNAESLAEKSKAKIDSFVDQCRLLVDTKNPPNKVTQLRNDCRDKYFNLFVGSLHSLLSSHDQVITVGNSRFGRTKIPTRETPKKVSREILYSSQRQVRSKRGSRGNVENTVHNVPNLDIAEGSEELSYNNKNDANNREDDSIQTWSKLNLPSVPLQPLSTSKSEENLKYVMKSGFKMPVKNKDKARSIVSPSSTGLGQGSVDSANSKIDDDSTYASKDGRSAADSVLSGVQV